MAVGYVVDTDARPTGVGIAGLDGRPIEAESESAESQAERGQRAATRTAERLARRPHPYGPLMARWLAAVGGHLLPPTARGWHDLPPVDCRDRDSRAAAARATVDDRVIRVGVRCHADGRLWHAKVVWWWPGRHAPDVERTVGTDGNGSWDPDRAIIKAWRDVRAKAERRIGILQAGRRGMVHDERGQATWVMTAGMMGVLGAAALAAVLLLHP